MGWANNNKKPKKKIKIFMYLPPCLSATLTELPT
jgi:hypothetical protein